MRALCDACGKPQPPDWSPGDQCVHCGQAARRELRCFWCAKWTPDAKFCRSCGAETVKPRLYGAARMLKDAGTDRFDVPKKLRRLGRDQVENFSRIYERHAAVASRHVEDLRFLERFLRSRHWSAALEDELIPQLPWPEESLERYAAPVAPAGDDLAVAQALAEKSPFPVTRQLAALVRLSLDDWSAHEAAASVFRSNDPGIRAEAALALTTWRVLWSVGRPRSLGRELHEELRRSESRLEAAVALGLLGEPNPELLREALADRRLSLGAALALGDVDRLRAALRGDDLEKGAAGRKLVELGVIKPVVKVVEKSPLELQRELVDSLARRKEPSPEAAPALLKIAETSDDPRLRAGAIRVLCRQIKPAWVLRLARAADGDRSVYQMLLQAEGLTPRAAEDLADFLLENGRFSLNQYGVSTLAEKGTLPFGFVPKRFGEAGEEAQKELLRFAEVQLAHGGDEALHRFVMGVVFGPHPAKIRAAAWWTLRRGYRAKGDVRGEGPFLLRTELVTRFFGSWRAFLPKLAAVLRDRETMKEVGYYEMMAHVLGSADEEAVAALQKEARGADELLDALLEAMRGDYWPQTRDAMMTLASRIAAQPKRQAKALEAFRLLNRKGNYYYDKALRRLELAAHGIPEESEWKALPADFVPKRFQEASPEGRRELLKLADHQLVHNKDETEGVVLPFLLELALHPGELRAEAMEIHADRARGPYGRFPLRREDVERGYGKFEAFLVRLPPALRDPGEAVDLLRELFNAPRPGDAEELAAAGEPGRALIRAMLEAVAAGDPGTQALRRTLIRHLERTGAHPAWREEVVEGLGRAAADLSSEAKRVMAALRPPPPPRSSPAKEVHAPSPDVWKEKQRLVERLGAELQATMFRLMAGPGTPEEKTREAQRLSQEYQAKIKELYS